MSVRFRFMSAAKVFAAAALCTVTAMSGFAVSAANDGISSGNGSSAKPYIIVSASGLLEIANEPGANYRLGCDIDLKGCLWVPLCDKFKPVHRAA